MKSGIEGLMAAAKKLEINFISLVAETAIWSSPEVFIELKKSNPNGTWYPNRRRAKKNEKKGTKQGNIVFDDNTHARNAIKKATGINEEIKDYTACHIWTKSCYDHRYHTCIANLILVPSPIASLTDHHHHVVECLKFRAFEIYGWYHEEKETPTRPICYPSNWKDCEPYTEKIKKALSKRQT